MPACFTLTRKGTDQPAKLVDVDSHMCEHFGVPCHPTMWHRGWYDLEGFALAIGKNWAWMRENFEGRDDIISFLEENYTPDAFTTIGR